MSSKSRGWIVAAVMLVVGGLPASAQTQVALGSEFQVNTYTSGYQGQVDLVVHDNGDFVIIWNSAGSTGGDTSGLSVQGRHYAADGTSVGGEFQVNSYTLGAQSFPTAAGVGDGSFVSVWDSQESAGTDTSGLSVQARRFDTAGAAIGNDFQVNTFVLGYQGRAEVDVGPSGEFAVVWVSSGSDGDDNTGTRSIQGRLYTAAGVALGPNFQVNSYTTGTQGRPVVAYASDGTFVVAWQSDSSPGNDSSGYSILARRFTAAGSPVGVDFQVNTYTSNDQERPVVEVASDGSFIVAWGSTGSPANDITNAILARRFDDMGSPIGDDFQVNTYTPGPQFTPDLAYGPDGDLLVTWESGGSPGSDNDFSVQARRLTATGAGVGAEFQINTYTTSFQVGPSVGIDGDGRFVVAWQSDGSGGTDTDDASVHAQRFATLIFADGFESGNTSAWSVTVP